MGQKGGKQPGAGRPKGSRNKATLEQQAVVAAFSQRILQKADELFNAQFRLAIGSTKVFRIDEEELDNGKTKRIHTLVTDADEIKDLLDEHDGGNGEVHGSYYYFTEVLPDNRAVDSLLNRGLGKPTETVKLDAEIGAVTVESAQELFIKQYQEIHHCSPEEAALAAYAAFEFNRNGVEDHTESTAS